jgi:hypothetical protein
MTRLEQAHATRAAGPDALGFPQPPSPEMFERAWLLYETRLALEPPLQFESEIPHMSQAEVRDHLAFNLDDDDDETKH